MRSYILFFGLTFALPSVSAQSNTIDLKVSRKTGEVSEKMVITRGASDTVVEFHDSRGESSLNRFSPENKSLETRYFNAGHNEYLKLIFNVTSGKIISTGSIAKVYPLEDPVYDGNGSVFYIFSKILPGEGAPLFFNLLQSKEKRIVKMYLKYMGEAKISVHGKTVEAVKYETGLVNRVLSFFWPYKYHYWFSVTTHEFLRYEGPVGHEDSEIIEVK